MKTRSAIPHIRVRNFKKFQHYKNRRPPWIKLYNDLLEDYDFGRLQDASKWLAIGIMLLASRYDNHVPADPEWIGRQLSCSDSVDLDPLLSAEFVETCGCEHCASASLACCKQSATLETERETEEETKEQTCSPDGERASVPVQNQASNGHHPEPKPKAEADFERWWSHHPKKVGKRKALVLWKRLRKAKELPPVEDMIAALDKQVKSGDWTRDGGQYIPHPTTYLNRGGWEDDLSGARARGPYGDDYDPADDYK